MNEAVISCFRLNFFHFFFFFNVNQFYTCISGLYIELYNVIRYINLLNIDLFICIPCNSKSGLRIIFINIIDRKDLSLVLKKCYFH